MASTSAISTIHHNATVHVTNLFLVDSGAMQSNIIPYYAMTLLQPKEVGTTLQYQDICLRAYVSDCIEYLAVHNKTRSRCRATLTSPPSDERSSMRMAITNSIRT